MCLPRILKAMGIGAGGAPVPLLTFHPKSNLLIAKKKYNLKGSDKVTGLILCCKDSVY